MTCCVFLSLLLWMQNLTMMSNLSQTQLLAALTKMSVLPSPGQGTPTLAHSAASAGKCDSFVSSETILPSPLAPAHHQPQRQQGQAFAALGSPLDLPTQSQIATDNYRTLAQLAVALKSQHDLEKMLHQVLASSQQQQQQQATPLAVPVGATATSSASGLASTLNNSLMANNAALLGQLLRSYSSASSVESPNKAHAADL